MGPLWSNKYGCRRYCYGYLIKQANDILREDLKRFTEIIGEKKRTQIYSDDGSDTRCPC